MRDSVEPFLKDTSGSCLSSRARLTASAILTAGMVLAVMIIPVHHFGLARSLAGGAARAARGRAGPGRDALGDPPGRWWCRTRGSASWVRSFWPGARAGRNHGGHHGDRKQSQHYTLRCSRRATPSPRSSPTSSPKPPATSIPARWSNWAWCCSLLTIVINGLARLLIVATTRKGPARA